MGENKNRALTYKELVDLIQQHPELMHQSVMIYLQYPDEYYPVSKVSITESDDVLDKGHLIIEVA